MKLPHREADAFVLAGGKSSRMGRDKALIQVAGRPLIQFALETLRGAHLEARVGGAQCDLSEFAPVIADAPGDSGLGPLAGVCAALAACTSRFAVFLPVDLPMIPANLIEYLVHHAVVTEAVVTVVSVAGFVQTFPAVVNCAALDTLRDRLHSDDRNCLKVFRAAAEGLSGGLSVLQVESLVQSGHVWDARALYPRQWFLNVNTPDDLRQVDELAGRSPVG